MLIFQEVLKTFPLLLFFTWIYLRTIIAFVIFHAFTRTIIIGNYKVNGKFRFITAVTQIDLSIDLSRYS